MRRRVLNFRRPRTQGTLVNVSLVSGGPTSVFWLFSKAYGNFSLGDEPRLEINASGLGWIGASNVLPSDAREIEAIYSVAVLPGDAWRLTAAPTRFDFPGSALNLPQSGTVI